MNDQQRSPCELCGKLVTQQRLKKHMKTHLSKFKCVTCSRNGNFLLPCVIFLTQFLNVSIPILEIKGHKYRSLPRMNTNLLYPSAAKEYDRQATLILEIE